MQELTDEAEARLKRAGLADLLPHRVTQPGPNGTRGSIYARYPLRGGRSLRRCSAARCTARSDLPSGQFVDLACVHAVPPRPPWSPGATARWRSQLSALPAPGDGPRILAGDFNATLDHAQFRRLLRRGYVDAASQVGNGLSPTWGPQPGRGLALLAIDHVLADRRCAVLSTSAHWLTGTDHRALYAELRLPAPHSRGDQAPQAHQMTATDNRHQAPGSSPPKTATAREQTSGPDRQSTASLTLASASRSGSAELAPVSPG